MAGRLASALAVALGGLGWAGCSRPAGAPAGSSAPLSATLDRVVADALAKREIPGASLVVVRDTEVVYSKGFGTANLATGEPVTDSTPFVIGSTSKPLTALGVLRLVQLGQLALDTPIVRYAPDLRFQDRRGEAITLRHLLTNRSGIVAGFSGPAYQRPPVSDDSALARLAQAMTKLPLNFAPGTGYTYSNRGWALAGYLIQRVSGRPVEDFMRDEVFRPLGMTQSTLEFWKVPNIAQGYVEGRATRNHPHPASITRAYGPAGMYVSTNRDVGRLLRTLMSGGRTYDGHQFLTPALVAEALRPQAEAESELGGPTRYGLGWEVDSMLGTTTIKKAGSVHSMVSLWVMAPERKTAIGLLFNREDYQIVPLVGNIFTALAGGEVGPFPAGEPVAEVAAPVAATIPAATRARWLGRYDTRVGDMTVFLRNDSLLADFEGSEALLVPTSDSTVALVDDLVSHRGKTLAFRRSGVVWSEEDSLGIKIRP